MNYSKSAPVGISPVLSKTLKPLESIVLDEMRYRYISNMTEEKDNVLWINMKATSLVKDDSRISFLSVGEVRKSITALYNKGIILARKNKGKKSSLYAINALNVTFAELLGESYLEVIVPFENDGAIGYVIDRDILTKNGKVSFDSEIVNMCGSRLCNCAVIKETLDVEDLNNILNVAYCMNIFDTSSYIKAGEFDITWCQNESNIPERIDGMLLSKSAQFVDVINAVDEESGNLFSTILKLVDGVVDIPEGFKAGDTDEPEKETEPEVEKEPQSDVNDTTMGDSGVKGVQQEEIMDVTVDPEPEPEVEKPKEPPVVSAQEPQIDNGVTKEEALVDYKKYCKFMRAGELKTKPVETWTGKDFVIFFYCAVAFIKKTNLNFPSWARDIATMKRLMDRYPVAHLKNVIKTYARNKDAISERYKTDLTPDMTVITTDWKFAKIEEFIKESGVADKRENSRKEFEAKQAEADALVVADVTSKPVEEKKPVDLSIIKSFREKVAQENKND